jgi:hypothetical protein
MPYGWAWQVAECLRTVSPLNLYVTPSTQKPRVPGVTPTTPHTPDTHPGVTHLSTSSTWSSMTALGSSLRITMGRLRRDQGAQPPAAPVARSAWLAAANWRTMAATWGVWGEAGRGKGMRGDIGMDVHVCEHKGVLE